MSKPIQRFTKTLINLEVGESTTTVKYKRPTVQSFAWRAGRVIYKGARQYAVSMVGKRVMVTRTA